MGAKKPVKARIEQLLCELGAGLFDKKESAALVLLASLAGEGIFLLGPPGVAKSLIARRFAFVWRGGVVFEYLMNRFSTPDEIFGPVSIARLKNEDRYERKTAGYLPCADIVFLDEIWKAGPAIQNALLTVLNEKLFRNGAEEIALPLKALIAASNGTAPKDEGLEALWDRFLVRVRVRSIQNNTDFLSMISADDNALCDTIPEKYKISMDEYQQWSIMINQVECGEAIKRVILYIKLQLPGDWYVSDRRWKKIVRLLRTSAFCNDLDRIELIDIMLIQHCIWNEENEIEKAKQLVTEAVLRHIICDSDDKDDIETIRAGLLNLHDEVRAATRTVEDSRRRSLALVQGHYYTARRGEKTGYIKNDDYTLLDTTERETALYRRQKVSQGYLRHNAHTQNQANVFSAALNERNIDLEAHFVQERCAKIARVPEAFALSIDGERWTLDTVLDGDCRKIRNRATMAHENVWDKKLVQYNTWIYDAKKIYTAFIKQQCAARKVHLFVSGADIKVLSEKIQQIQNELDMLLMQAAEIEHSYKNIEEGFVLIDAPLSV